ncbi:nuclear transport factor 2 family protein [Skermania piniformis]|uniref:Ketosteroid isomerase family protein n=1 Tax=Skermania pinensis TaxID=39122 RepID=A0ABX8SG70_9ACTN|nr:nuclear transport factor 2 family protein [Skermania piniformis]QXQ15435.1 ketosteroid isomerase family protein [Skermania piniformis]
MTDDSHDMPTSAATAAALLAFVERSPAAVAARDRTAWLTLFADDAQVADPVGARPHVGSTQIGRFYDTFVGPNQIEFEVGRDLVCGTTVIRDVTLHTRMWGGAELRVPAFLRYELSVVAGEPRSIRRLYAYWELPAMLVQLRETGPRGALAAAVLAPNLLGRQGVGGAVGFVRGLDRVGGWAKADAAGFAGALRRGDPAAAAGMLAPDAALWTGETPGSIEDVVAVALGAGWSKMIVAGRTVSMALAGPRGPAVLLLTFGSRRTGITGCRLYSATGRPRAAD